MQSVQYHRVWKWRIRCDLIEKDCEDLFLKAFFDSQVDCVD